jgi:predicted transcriptional regulator
MPMHGEVRRWLAGQIARRQARGESCRAIGRTLGIARKTVRTLIAEEMLRLATGASGLVHVAKPPRVPRRSKLDRFQTRIDFWLATHKGLTAVRLHELLREEGFQGGLTTTPSETQHCRHRFRVHPVEVLTTAQCESMTPLGWPVLPDV